MAGSREFVLAGLVLAINFMATLIYLFFLSRESRKEQFYNLPFWLQKSFVVLFVGPLFISPFLPQVRMTMGFYRFPISLGFIIGGVVIIIGAFFKIGVIPSLKEKSTLITQGVYGIVRHPIYFGTILTFLGLILFTNALLSLLYFPISIALYFLMTIYEEKSLISEYGQEYVVYQKTVRKKIIPYVL